MFFLMSSASTLEGLTLACSYITRYVQVQLEYSSHPSCSVGGTSEVGNISITLEAAFGMEVCTELQL